MVTPWGGMLLIKEFYDSTGMHEQLYSLPLMDKSNSRGIDHNEIIECFIMSVVLGTNNCNVAAQLSYDNVLKEIFQWKHGMPSQSSLSRFFPKYYGELSGVIFSKFNQWWHNALDYNNMTLDVDSTIITRFGEQEGAEVGYNPRYLGRKSHHPILASLAGPKIVVNSWIRSYNSASNTEFIEFLQNTFTMVPRQKVLLLRDDSGFCSNKIFTYLEGIGLDCIIAAPMKAGLVNHRLSTLRFNCIAIEAYLRISTRKTTLVMTVKGKKREYIKKFFHNIERFKPRDKFSIV